ncbi:uncharacterized protein LOC133456583 isoform X1 [Cololabis saira]|uniref:uncharacterized protein LOC133456583 isoform X1 n=1 Tax=Cololabis saira TaxID=129043 RepID=UPI002AD28616|nr:uncharacterized protein LOC133456583 isoform X1 [Cololabis saira]
MSGCCVNGCTNRHSPGGLKFYRIPRGSRPFQSNRRRLWLQAIKREDWNEDVIKNARVCGAHFISGEASLEYDSPDFVPSVFVSTKQSQKPDAKMDRSVCRKKVFKTAHFQKQEKTYSDHCCVPLCTASAKFNGVLSFHGFPTRLDLRRHWLINIRRDNFTITSHTNVCSRHFAADQLIEPKTLNGRRRLIKGAVPTLFEWNDYTVPPEEQEQLTDVTMDHNYCSVPEPSAPDTSLSTVEDLTEELQDLRKEMQELRVQREFGLQRFAGSDADIRFYTRFPSYNHLMAFWFLVEPSFNKMVRVSRAKLARRNEAGQLLQPIDEFFLFLVFLSVGLKERDLAHRFNIHESTVSRIIANWTRCLATLLGSQCIWLTPAEVKAYLPEAFRDFPDTQVILDVTELRWQTPVLQSETYCTLKALVGIAPHGAVTFVSDLYAGSVSDTEIFRRSGISELLTEDVAVMADKGFQISDCCKCRVYCPPFVSKQKQMPADQVRETQAMARLRDHVERVIGRIKQNKLFDGVILLSHVYNIKQLFAVACMLSNYQNKVLV